MKITLLLLLVLILNACDSASNTKSAEQIQAELEANQKKFVEERARIERERQAQEEKLKNQRRFISVNFISVTESELVVELTNETNKDIDNIMGSLEVLDLDGKTVTSTGITLWVPGDVYLRSGTSQLVTKNLNMDRPESIETLLTSASDLNYYFTLMRYQYVGESEVNLENPAAIVPTMIQEADQTARVETKDPLEQASPEDCPVGQWTKYTPKEYYPGPKCEHISRNLDSEVHKKEYMLICTGGKFEAWMVSPVASVQIASCKRDLNSNGIYYSKQLCCQEPE